MEEQTPDLAYLDTDRLVISVVDERWRLDHGKSTEELGVARGAFGIPTGLKTYPWLVDKEHKGQLLAEALGERIVFGLNDEGWDTHLATFTSKPTEKEISAVLEEKEASNFLVMVLKDWWVDINTNWVSAFKFDWDVLIDIYDVDGQLVGSYQGSGRDIVDESATDSWPNMFRRAYRARLISILEQPEISTALDLGHRPAIPADASASSGEVGASKYDQLEQLKALYDDGVLTNGEFEAEKKRLLSD
jgi:hypothetical protein